MRNSYIYIGAFILFLFYTLFFTVETGEEYILAPRRVLHPTSGVTESFKGESSVVGVELSDYAGFAEISGEEDATLSFRILPKKDRVSISPSALIFYNEKDSKKKSLLVSDLSQVNYQSTGWPLQIAGRVFLYDAAGASIEERDYQGNLLWEKDINSFLTTISATEDRLLLGTVDGTCILLDKNGREVFSYTPEFGGFAVIVGAVLSADGKTFAVISGKEPQRLEVFRLVGDEEKGAIESELFYSEDLTISFGRPIKIFFEESEETLQVLFESQEGVRKICFDTGETSRLFYFGALAQFRVNPLNGNITFLSGTPDKGNISLYTAKERLIYQEFFNADFRSVTESENYSFFSLDNNLLIVEKIYE